MEEKKYRAIKYIRLSDSDGNIGESDSVTNQRRLIEEFIKKNPDIEDVGEKIDDGYTGINFDKRPAYKEMMDLIRAGKVNCCITKDLSRLGREFIETVKHVRDIFPELGCRFIAINDNFDTLTNNGYGIDSTVRMAMNDAYSMDISKKVRSVLDSKRENGEYVGAFALYGYKRTADNRNKLVIDECAASVVREIFDMKIEGFSSLRIAQILNERGVLSPIRYKKEHGLPYAKRGYGDKEDAKWSVSTILRMLKDETYTGTLVQGIYSTPNYKIKTVKRKPEKEWKRFENAHEAIIEKSKFELIQQILKLDTRTSPNDDKVRIFAGLLTCGSCGGPMSPKSVSYKGTDVKYNYYHCPKTKKRGCKDAVWFKEDELIRRVLEHCNAHINRMASLDRFFQKVEADKVAREHANKLEAQLHEKEQKLRQQREADGALYKDMVNSVITEVEYKSIKKELNEEIDSITKSIEQLTAEIKETLSNNNEIPDWTRHYRKFDNLVVLNRGIVVNLIRYIEIISKTEIKVHFNNIEEFEAQLTIAKGVGYVETNDAGSGLL